MTNPTLPTKEELKQKYNILDDDFEILAEAPSTAEIQSKGILIKLGEVFGASEWMWQSWKGTVIAIIIVYTQASSFYSALQPVAAYSYGKLASYLEHYEIPEHVGPTSEPKDYIAFYPQNTPIPSSTDPPPTGSLPIGTGLYPWSGESFV